MISFFITEYVKKYPQLKGKKYLNANEIFKIDNNLFQKSLKYHDEERKKSISEYEMERKNIEMEIESKYLYTTEEIEEYVYELKEYLEENFIILETKIEMGIIKNNQVWLKSRYGVSSWIPQQDHIQYSKEKLFYFIEFSIDKNSLSENENISKTKLSEIYSKIKELINLPNDLKLFKYGLSEYSDDPFISRHSLFSMLLDDYNLIITIEQN